MFISACTTNNIIISRERVDIIVELEKDVELSYCHARAAGEGDLFFDRIIYLRIDTTSKKTASCPREPSGFSF